MLISFLPCFCLILTTWFYFLRVCYGKKKNSHRYVMVMMMLEMQNAAHSYLVVRAFRTNKKRHDHTHPEEEPPAAMTTNLTAPPPPPPAQTTTKDQNISTSQPS